MAAVLEPHPVQRTGGMHSAFPAESGEAHRCGGWDALMESPVRPAADRTALLDLASSRGAHFRGTLEAGSSAIISTDVRGRVTAVSEGCDAVLGAPRNRILGQHLGRLFSNLRLDSDPLHFMGDPPAPLVQRIRVSRSKCGCDCYWDISLQKVYEAGNRPVGFLCTIRDVTEAVRIRRKLEEFSILDELTGLYNQRWFFARLAGEIERSRRYNLIFSLCFLDLDGFKRYNDSRGHVQGDRALMDCARLIAGPVRSDVDACFRYGGDEFTIMMPETNRFQARVVCRRILRGLARHFNDEITASAGIAEFPAVPAAQELIETADRAMYRAKAMGGNRIAVAS